MCGSDRPSASATWRNLRRPMPLALKMRLVLRNEWLKVRRLDWCCDHPGEPGC